MTVEGQANRFDERYLFFRNIYNGDQNYPTAFVPVFSLQAKESRKLSASDSDSPGHFLSRVQFPEISPLKNAEKQVKILKPAFFEFKSEAFEELSTILS